MIKLMKGLFIVGFSDAQTVGDLFVSEFACNSYWVMMRLLLLSFMRALWKGERLSFLSGFTTVVESLMMLLFW
jgi:hypothetical protein